MQRLTKVAYSLQKDIKLYRTQQLDVITWGDLLTCGKGVTELQNLTNLRLSSFAESHQMQQKNFDVSPNKTFFFSSCAVLEIKLLLYAPVECRGFKTVCLTSSLCTLLL